MITFAGNTNTSSPTDILSLHYDHDPAGFSVDVPVGPGWTSLPDLGTFTLNGCTFVQSAPCEDIFNHIFTLKITFTTPTVSGSAEIDAAISGTFGRAGNSDEIKNGSSLTIDFDNSVHTLLYSGGPGGSFGQFDVYVDDVAVFGPYPNSGSKFSDANLTRQVVGHIGNLTQEFPKSIPEPSTLLTLGSGLLVLGRFFRSGKGVGSHFLT